MEWLTIVAIIVVLTAGTIAAIVAIAKVSAFYKQCFGFSIWSGVLLFVVALSLAVVAIVVNLDIQVQFILLTISVLLVLLTGYNDIRLAGSGWGVVSLGLQILFSLGFILVVAVALILFVLKKIFNLHSSLLKSIFENGFSIRNELLLLALFLHF